jgi:phage terminase large subunit
MSLYRNDPVKYFEDRLGVRNLWGGEKAILQAIPRAIDGKIKKIVVPSGHSLGKDFTCAGLVPYFLETYGPCLVITTAPTDRQVNKIMWGEIANHYNRAPGKLIGELLTQEIKVTPDCYAIGFTTKETGAAIGKFQGFHSPRVFVIASEAQAIDDKVYEQIDAILTGDIGLLIEIGNPLRATGQFARDIADRKNNIVIELSCLANPNYINKKAMVPGLCSYEWVEDKRRRWGEDDPRWAARVLGKVPKCSIDTIFNQALIDKMKLSLTKDTQVRRGVAVDVGRFGDDETCIYGGTNGMVEHQDIYAGLSTTATASRSAIVNTKTRGNFIVVDADGVGSGTVDTLNDMAIAGVEIIELHSAGKPRDDQFENLRAEMWFTAKKRAEEGRASIPDDDMLIEELLEVKFFFNKRGKIQIELKEDVKERLGRSPNRADTWIYLQHGFEGASVIRTNDYKNSSVGSSGRVSSGVYGGVGAMGA